MTGEDDWRPSNPALLTAFTAWRAGELELALAAMSAHCAAHTSDPDGWRGLGSVLWSLGRHGDALAAFQRAVRLDPWSAMHWSNVGLALRDLGHLGRAQATFQVATGLQSKYAPAWNEWGNVLIDAGQPDAALPLYDRALALIPGRAVYHHNRGMARWYCGDTVGAVAGFRTALSLDPEYAWSARQLELIAGATVCGEAALSHAVAVAVSRP